MNKDKFVQLIWKVSCYFCSFLLSFSPSTLRYLLVPRYEQGASMCHLRTAWACVASEGCARVTSGQRASDRCIGCCCRSALRSTPRRCICSYLVLVATSMLEEERQGRYGVHSYVPSPGRFSGRTSGKLSVRIMYLRSRLRFFRCEGFLLLYVLSVRWAFKGSTFPRKLTRLCCELGAGIRLGPRTR